MKSPKILILVECAGFDPWKSIEVRSQEPILRELFGERAEIVWVNGLYRPSEEENLHPSIRLLRRQLKLTGSSKGVFRKILRALISLNNFRAIGQKKAKKHFYQRFAGYPVAISGSRVTLPFPTQIHIAGLRTLETFRYILLTYQFDYVLRISSTCLVLPTALFNLVRELPPTRVFAGTEFRFGWSFFMSGASTLMSRDVAENVVKFESQYSLLTYEDVALSALIRSKDLAEFYQLPRVNLTSPSELPSNLEAWESVPIIRCKAGPSTNSIEPVIVNMEAVRRFLAAKNYSA